MSLMKFAEMDESEARDFFEGIRWPDGPECPHCGHDGKIYDLNGDSTRDGLKKCSECRKQFTVTVGTVMHKTKIPLKKWLMGIHLICSSKKGISALQLKRNLDLGSYRSAWHMAHRIRTAMRKEPLKSMLEGTVEADETYVGGKSRKGIKGRGSERKTAVFALVERDGDVRSKPVERVTKDKLQGEIRENVDPESRIMTDEMRSYIGIGEHFEGGHALVSHGDGEYVQGDVHTNNAESFFALLKRGINGIFHHVGKHNLERYCDEFNFRWGTRKMNDVERTRSAIRGIEGKRLMLERSC